MFSKAKRTQRKLRMALYGASGSGKTYTALVVAKALGNTIALIDTEHSSASLYADSVAAFDSCDLTHYSPREYIQAINAAKSYDTLIIDSLSHAWMGEGGLLDQADKKGGRFDAWKDLTPQQTELFETMLTFPGHIIATMRSKTAYSVVKYEKDGKEKTRVERIGLEPIQRKESEYEFDVVAHLDQDNIMHIVKSRFEGLDADIRKPNEKFALKLRSLLETGAAPAPAPATPKTNGTYERLEDSLLRIRRAVEACEKATTQAEVDALAVNLDRSPAFIRSSGDVQTAFARAQERVRGAS